MNEIAVVGGGLAGGAAATLLAQGGARVVLFERTREPHDKVCGEFLSTEARAHLAAVGLDLARLGGHEITRVRLIAGRRTSEAALPFRALGLSRRRLDEALLEHAARAGARIERGVNVRAVTPDGLETTTGPVRTRVTCIASGKHDVRGVGRDVRGTIDGLIGFKAHYRVGRGARAALEGCVELVLFDGGYAGLQLVEDGLLNLCLVVHADRFTELGGTWENLIKALECESHLARRLAAIEPLASQPVTIARVPYGFVHRPLANDAKEVFRLGDQFAVIPSYCGDGMAIALHSGRLAARAILAGASSAMYHERLRQDVARQVRLATWIQRCGAGAIGRRALVVGLQWMPRALSAIAASTRVSAAALHRAGVQHGQPS